jgi:hypothetical protein
MCKYMYSSVKPVHLTGKKLSLDLQLYMASVAMMTYQVEALSRRLDSVAEPIIKINDQLYLGYLYKETEYC